MKRSHTLRSVIVFSLFSLLGPLIQRVSLPAFLSMHREELVLMFWPAIVLSAGGRANDPHDLWMSVTVNLVVFVLLGLVIGVLGTHPRAVGAIYICLCALLTLVEAWGSGFSLAYFSWSVLVLAYLVYWLPFWAVIWRYSSQMRPGSVH
jgi:hypothetical protein